MASARPCHAASSRFRLRSRLAPVRARIDRAKFFVVRASNCDGEALYRDGRFTRVDRDAVLKPLHEDPSRALSDDEVERRKLSKALLPHVKASFDGHIDPARHEPFYRQSSRV
jgi:hypothetical protein